MAEKDPDAPNRSMGESSQSENEMSGNARKKRFWLPCLAVVLVSLVLALDGAAGGHAWAVGWLRRLEGLEPLPFAVKAVLETLGVLAALTSPFILTYVVRISSLVLGKAGFKEIDSPFDPADRAVISWLVWYEPRAVGAFALQTLLIFLLGFFDFGLGTLALASCLAGAWVFVSYPHAGSGWIARDIFGIAVSAYAGFALAHWSGVSWWVGFGAAAAVHFVPMIALLLLARGFRIFSVLAVLAALPFALFLRFWLPCLAVVLVSLVLALDGAAGGHAWAVGWLRRLEGLEPLPFAIKALLETLGVLAALTSVFILMYVVRISSLLLGKAGFEENLKSIVDPADRAVNSDLGWYAPRAVGAFALQALVVFLLRFFDFGLGTPGSRVLLGGRVGVCFLSSRWKRMDRPRHFRHSSQRLCRLRLGALERSLLVGRLRRRRRRPFCPDDCAPFAGEGVSNLYYANCAGVFDCCCADCRRVFARPQRFPALEEACAVCRRDRAVLGGLGFVEKRFSRLLSGLGNRLAAPL